MILMLQSHDLQQTTTCGLVLSCLSVVCPAVILLGEAGRSVMLDDELHSGH